MLRETNGLYLIYAAYAPLDDDVRDNPHGY